METLLRLKWILILEALFAGAYIALTRGLFIIYLSSMEYRLDEISWIIFVASGASLLISVLLYKRISFLVKRVKVKLVIFHAFERVVWLIMPLATTSFMVAGLFTLYHILSTLIAIFLIFAIYGALSEADVREVTAKRSAATGVSSIIGFAFGAFLLAFLPPETKFASIFFAGALLGMLSTALVFFLDLSTVEGSSFPKATAQPEKIFSTSAFFVILMSASNLIGIVWTPFIMTQLNGADWLVASMSLAATVASIGASLFWRKSPFKTLRIALALNLLGPILILFIPWADVHIGINAFTAFTFTGANFVGIFLFAGYTKWFGAAKSSLMLIILGTAAQFAAAPLGILAMGNYTAIFLIILGIKIVSTIVAFVTIPEVAVVPEDAASTYSQVLYTASFLGYRISVDISKQTIKTIVRLLAFSLIIAILYLIYRILWIWIA